MLSAIVGGIAATLVSGLFPHTSPLLAGAVWYGYPLSWLIRMIVAPSYNPWTILWLSFLIDVLFWSIVAGAMIGILKMPKRTATPLNSNCRGHTLKDNDVVPSMNKQAAGWGPWNILWMIGSGVALITGILSFGSNLLQNIGAGALTAISGFFLVISTADFSIWIRKRLHQVQLPFAPE